MIPTTVGELRRFLSEFPADMPFDVDVRGMIGGIDDMKLGVQQYRNGWDGKQLYKGTLVLKIDVTC